MALKDAVLEIADSMAEYIRQSDNEGAKLVVISFAQQLKIAVKAAEGQINSIDSIVLGASNESASLQNARMVEQAREEFRKGKKSGNFQEAVEPRMVLAVDGPEDGVMVPLAQDAPMGARVRLGEVVYELRADGQLHAMAVS